jgi:hypothetical protein
MPETMLGELIGSAFGFLGALIGILANVRSQLKDHISKISSGFPARFRSSASRLSVKAIK